MILNNEVVNIMSLANGDIRRVRRISAGAVILKQMDDKWHVLLLRAFNHWDFPKGNVEQGESLIIAATREVKEETGIEDLVFPWGQMFARTSVYSKDKVAYYVIATSQTESVVLAPNPETGVKEHEEFKWVEWTDVRSWLSPRLSTIIDWVESVAALEKKTNPGCSMKKKDYFFK